MNQERLNEDVLNYCNIAWGLTHNKYLRDNPIYIDHDITPTPDEYHAKLQGQNPECIMSVASDRLKETKTMDGKIVFSWKNWFTRLYNKVRGCFK